MLGYQNGSEKKEKEQREGDTGSILGKRRLLWRVIVKFYIKWSE